MILNEATVNYQDNEAYVNLELEEKESCLKRVSHKNDPFHLLVDFPKHIWRGLSTNLSISLASNDERKELEKRGNLDAKAVDYMAYRRSCLVVALPLMITGILLRLGEPREQMNLYYALQGAFPPQVDFTWFEPVFNTLKYMTYVELAVSAIAWILVFVAITQWTSFKKSRHYLMLSFILYFVAPYIPSILPYRLLVKEPTTPVASQQIHGLAQLLVSLYVATLLFFGLIAPTFSLVPSVLRAIMNIRTLFPRSSLPGYLLAFVPVIITPFCWVMITYMLQLSGTFGLLIELFIFIAAPFVTVIFLKHLVDPMSDKEAAKKALRIRILFLMLYCGALILMIFTLLKQPMYKSVLKHMLSGRMIVTVVIDFVAHYYITNAAVGDLVLRVILGDWSRTQKDEEEEGRYSDLLRLY